MTIEHATVAARDKIRGHESAASWCFSFLGAGSCAFAAVNMTQGATWLTRGWLAVGCLYLAMPWVNRTFGVDLTPEFANVRGFRRRAVPWARVQAVVSDKKSNGAVVVRLILENGKRVTLRAPTRIWGLGGAAYDRDFHRIGQWWLTHRGESWRPLLPEAPRNPYALPDTR